ncbi:MAG: hypothetical protein JWR15_176 [Prosthecobacter sp.]|nr:hypothetical protein [Prosthecobacter sp.]
MLSHLFRIRSSSIIVLAAACITTAVSAQQTDKAKDAPPVAPGGKMTVKKSDEPIEGERRIAFPSPYARMLGIETALKKAGVQVDWAAAYQKRAIKNLKVADVKNDKGTLGFTLGVRLADGVIAFMGKDQGRLKACAQDVKALAEKLGVKRDDLGSIGPLVRAVEDEDWTEIYWHMGVLQQEVVTSLDKNKDRSMTAIIASGAWLQGMRYATDTILKSISKVNLSNMVRAAAIPDLLSKELQKTPADVLELPAVKKSIKVLDAVRPLIDVGIDADIPAEKLQEIEQLATGTIDDILQ